MRTTKILLILLLSALSVTLSAKEVTEDDVLGFWLSQERTAMIQIKKEKGKIVGDMVWLKRIHTGEVKDIFDVENPKKSKRSRSLMGLRMLKGFKFKGKKWSGGEIYDPKSGKTYDSTMKLKDANTLKLRGFIGISLIGKTRTWSRQRSATPDIDKPLD